MRECVGVRRVVSMRSDANESETVREEEEEEEEVAMGVCDSLDCETMDGVNCGV